MLSNFLSVFVLATATLTLAQKCPIQFDGRVPAGSTPALFDVAASPFNTGYVKGANLSWSQIIQFPNLKPSLFDKRKFTKALEVTINDKSIFAPSETNIQTGFRRAELLPTFNSGRDNSTVGIKTLHFSLRKDNARPLNITHEYQLVFLESADFSTNQFALKTGTIIGGAAKQDPGLLVLQSNVKAPTNLFTVAFKKDVWHNFGVVLDFTKNTTQILYSTNRQPLKAVTRSVTNDISGQGQFHFGLLKKPTGDNLAEIDITKQGFQPSGINEGVVYGGIFEENSANACISTS